MKRRKGINMIAPSRQISDITYYNDNREVILYKQDHYRTVIFNSDLYSKYLRYHAKKYEEQHPPKDWTETGFDFRRKFLPHYTMNNPGPWKDYLGHKFIQVFYDKEGNPTGEIHESIIEIVSYNYYMGVKTINFVYNHNGSHGVIPFKKSSIFFDYTIEWNINNTNCRSWHNDTFYRFYIDEIKD
jgi:hypothetical protein